MTHDEFIKKLNDLKDEAESAKEDYLTCLENQKKAKMTWAILKSQILKLRSDYDKSKNALEALNKQLLEENDL